ncbi:MAG: hypothetical protein K2N01_00315 [Lachnospiraceae bacterium]|nr:hypothetical protein [Lachnospiraceae bacterium]
MSSYEAYTDYVRADEQVKEVEEIMIMEWFGPRVRYEMIQEWNKNGIRGWGNWSEETCDLIEKALEEDDCEEEEKQNALRLLNGGLSSGVKLDVCTMDIGAFESVIMWMEQIAGREGICNERGRRIEEGEIAAMWSDVNGRVKLRQTWNVKRVQRHWKLIAFAVILFVFLCKVYTDYVRTEK